MRIFIKTRSKNQNINIIFRSAGNLAGSSETIRELSEQEKDWLAGILDGDGSFEIRDVKFQGRIIKQLKTICITLHPRDSRIIYRVKDLLGGKIRIKNKKYIYWSICNKLQMINCLNMVNGRIRLKIPGFKKACELYNMPFIEPDYKIKPNSAYLAGLIDTDGSIVYSHHRNCIIVNLEFNKNEYTSQLDLTEVIPTTKIHVYSFIKRNQTADKVFYSIRFTYQNVENMLPLYNYFLINRLYSDFKFYRAMQIKRFLELRQYNNYLEDSPEYLLYYNMVKNFLTHLNEHKSLPKTLKKPI